MIKSRPGVGPIDAAFLTFVLVMAKASAQAVQIRKVGHDALGAGSADGRRLTSTRCQSDAT